METQQQMLRRGDIVIAKGSAYGNPESYHCAVIVSNNKINAFSSNVVVCWIRPGDNRLDLSTHARVYSSGIASTVAGEAIQFIAKKNIDRIIGECNEIEMERINRCIGEAVLCGE